MKTYLPAKFAVVRDQDRCIRCQVCVNQCTFETHVYNSVSDDQFVKLYPRFLGPYGRLYAY